MKRNHAVSWPSWHKRYKGESHGTLDREFDPARKVMNGCPERVSLVLKSEGRWAMRSEGIRGIFWRKSLPLWPAGKQGRWREQREEAAQWGQGSAPGTRPPGRRRWRRSEGLGIPWGGGERGRAMSRTLLGGKARIQRSGSQASASGRARARRAGGAGERAASSWLLFPQRPQERDLAGVTRRLPAGWRGQVLRGRVGRQGARLFSPGSNLGLRSCQLLRMSATLCSQARRLCFCLLKWNCEPATDSSQWRKRFHRGTSALSSPGGKYLGNWLWVVSPQCHTQMTCHRMAHSKSIHNVTPTS